MTIAWGGRVSWFEICNPKRLVFDNWKDATKYINNNIGYSNLYYSLYKYENIKKDGKVDRESVVVNKLFFDFDKKRESFLDDCRKLYLFLKENDIKHEIRLSGNGFHALVHTNVFSIKNKRACLFNAQHYFIDNLKLNIDSQTIGNIAQEIRIPNTFNFKAKRFCIPITGKELLNLSLEEIYKLGMKQRFNLNNVEGDILFDISKFDKELDYTKEINDIKYNIEVSKNEDTLLVVNGTTKVINMLPFLTKILNDSKNNWNREMGHWNRAYIILWLASQGLGLEEIRGVLKEYLTKDEFWHMNSMERQVDYLWKRLPMNNSTNPMLFPNISTLMSKGYKLNKVDIELIESLKERESEV